MLTKLWHFQYNAVLGASFRGRRYSAAVDSCSFCRRLEIVQTGRTVPNSHDAFVRANGRSGSRASARRSRGGGGLSDVRGGLRPRLGGAGHGAAVLAPAFRRRLPSARGAVGDRGGARTARVLRPRKHRLAAPTGGAGSAGEENRIFHAPALGARGPGGVLWPERMARCLGKRRRPGRASRVRPRRMVAAGHGAVSPCRLRASDLEPAQRFLCVFRRALDHRPAPWVAAPRGRVDRGQLRHRRAELSRDHTGRSAPRRRFSPASDCSPAVRSAPSGKRAIRTAGAPCSCRWRRGLRCWVCSARATCAPMSGRMSPASPPASSWGFGGAPLRPRVPRQNPEPAAPIVRRNLSL
jgi:hypothetical protein